MNKLFPSLLVIGLAAVCATAETVPQVLTWQDCVQLAASNNPDFLASLYAMQSRHADYKGSYNGILPQIDFAHSYREAKTGNSRPQGSWAATASANLNLIDASEWASIQSALASYRQTQASHRLSGTSVLLDLYRTFSGLLYAQDAIGVNKAIRDTWKMNAQMIQLRYQSGRESKGNAMNTQAQLFQAEANVEQAERELSAARTELRRALGGERFLVTAVTGTWTIAQTPPTPPDFDGLLAQLPAIQVQQAVVDQARVAIRSARSSIWPTLALNYNTGNTGPDPFPNTPFWSFGGVLRLPILAGGPTATYYAVQAAQRSFDQAQQDFRSVKNLARSDLETRWSSFMQAQDQVRIQDAFLKAAEQRKAESDIRYQSGLMSFEDWNRVVSDYVSFQTNFLRARQNRVVAEAQWRFSQGESI